MDGTRQSLTPAVEPAPSVAGSGWVPRQLWHAGFLAALRNYGVVRKACEAVNVSRQAAYNHRESDAEFARAWDEALEDFADTLEQEVVRRAMGTKELVIYQGKPCGVWVNDDGAIVSEVTPGAKLIPLYENRYSDGLIQFELRGRRPQKYNPPKDAAAKDGGDTHQPAGGGVVIEEGPAVVLPDNGRGDGPTAEPPA